MASVIRRRFESALKRFASGDSFCVIDCRRFRFSKRVTALSLFCSRLACLELISGLAFLVFETLVGENDLPSLVTFGGLADLPNFAAFIGFATLAGLAGLASAFLAGWAGRIGLAG